MKLNLIIAIGLASIFVSTEVSAHNPEFWKAVKDQRWEDVKRFLASGDANLFGSEHAPEDEAAIREHVAPDFARFVQCLVQNAHPDMSEGDAQIGAQLLIRRQVPIGGGAFVDLLRILPRIVYGLSKISAKDTGILIGREAAVPGQAQADNPPSIVAPRQDGYAARENQLVTEFQGYARYRAVQPAQRITQFVVLLPPAPDLPRNHFGAVGADQGIHPTNPICYDSSDLLKRGYATLNYLFRQKGSGRPCPNLIFMLAPITHRDDPLSARIHGGHTLSDFARAIQEERQLPLEFHFAGHAHPSTGLGPITLEKRIPPEQLAEMFDQVAECNKLKESLLSKKQIVFVFHACNGAYVEVSSTDSDSAIKTKILRDSVIGRFYRSMMAQGYHNIKVIGYRGFYQCMDTGSGIRIIESLGAQKDYDAEPFKHVIERIKGQDVVTLPTSARWPINLPPAQSRQ